MARKRERRKPQVPRSGLNRRSGRRETERAEVPVSAERNMVPASLSGPRNISQEEFHRYVKGDLTRIAIFGTLIMAGMLALKFFGL